MKTARLNLKSGNKVFVKAFYNKPPALFRKMSRVELENDLQNSIINFDRRVLVTELLEHYELELEDIQEVLLLFLKEQEQRNGSKYDKRFAVWAEEQLNEDDIKEVCKIVEESKLAECKLQKLESMLYSVEILGGAKPAAAIFKPMAVAKDAKLKQGPKKQWNGVSSLKQNVKWKDSPDNKIDEKVETKSTAYDSNEKPTISNKARDKQISNKTSPIKNVKNQKGINSYFSNGISNKKPEESKNIKKLEVAPKKLNDFFKKQEEKPSCSSILNANRKEPLNASMQLFEEGGNIVDVEEEIDEIESSDEEEKLEALKRDIITSDVEIDDKEMQTSNSCKRRRIIDSDDEDNGPPPEKQEKLENIKKAEEDFKPQTFLDEDGFIITVKPKSGNKSLVKNKTKSSPESKKPIAQNAKKSTVPVNANVKSKQSGIKNYFSKK